MTALGDTLGAYSAHLRETVLLFRTAMRRLGEVMERKYTQTEPEEPEYTQTEPEEPGCTQTELPPVKPTGDLYSNIPEFPETEHYHSVETEFIVRTRVDAVKKGHRRTVALIENMLRERGASVDGGRIMIVVHGGDPIPFDEIPLHSVEDATGTVTAVEKNYVLVGANVYVPRMLLGHCHPAVGQTMRMRIVPNLGLNASLELHTWPWKAVGAYLCGS
jgi:hypothetical protein